jgi:hypothetical protein
MRCQDKAHDTVWSHFMRRMRSWRPHVIQDKFWNTRIILVQFLEIHVLMAQCLLSQAQGQLILSRFLALSKPRTAPHCIRVSNGPSNTASSGIFRMGHFVRNNIPLFGKGWFSLASSNVPPPHTNRRLHKLAANPQEARSLLVLPKLACFWLPSCWYPANPARY